MEDTSETIGAYSVVADLARRIEKKERKRRTLFWLYAAAVAVPIIVGLLSLTYGVSENSAATAAVDKQLDRRDKVLQERIAKSEQQAKDGLKSVSESLARSEVNGAARHAALLALQNSQLGDLRTVLQRSETLQGRTTSLAARIAEQNEASKQSIASFAAAEEAIRKQSNDLNNRYSEIRGQQQSFSDQIKLSISAQKEDRVQLQTQINSINAQVVEIQAQLKMFRLDGIKPQEEPKPRRKGPLTRSLQRVGDALSRF